MTTTTTTMFDGKSERPSSPPTRRWTSAALIADEARRASDIPVIFSRDLEPNHAGGGE